MWCRVVLCHHNKQIAAEETLLLEDITDTRSYFYERAPALWHAGVCVCACVCVLAGLEHVELPSALR